MLRNTVIFFVTASLTLSALLRAETVSTSQSTTDSEETPALSSKERLIAALPPSIGDGLDFSLWGWLGGYRNDQHGNANFYDAEFGFGITKSFDQKFAISAQGNFIDANGDDRGELEQAYISAVINQDIGAYLTIGKFNANFGTEARDFWSRTTSTSSLLFGAQPQDLVGAMINIPIGHTGITLRPFVSEDFQGQYDFNQSPSAGFMTEYQPVHGVDVAVTGWVGPGIVLFGGHDIHPPYDRGGYGAGSSSLIANWQGPNMVGQRGGTLYFVEAKATWDVTNDLHLATEFVQGTSGTKFGRWGWFGFLGQVDYDLTDRWNIYGRFSYLDDISWLITGDFQRYYEYSIGTGYELFTGVNVRGEYRHDESAYDGNSDTFSVHLALTY